MGNRGTKAIVIQIQGRAWKDIEESVGALSLIDPTLAIADDIIPFLTAAQHDFPSDINSLISEYAAVSGIVPDHQHRILQLRTYALYKCGRLQAARFCRNSLDYQISITWEWMWSNRLADESYYATEYKDARELWMCTNTKPDGFLRPTIDGALAFALEGRFVEALALTNQMPEHSSRSWRLLIRAMALTGLQMFDEALQNLSSCILQARKIYESTQALALKRAIEEGRRDRSIPIDSDKLLQWILDVHKRAAQSLPPVVCRDPLPDCVEYRLPLKK